MVTCTAEDLREAIAVRSFAESTQRPAIKEKRFSAFIEPDSENGISACIKSKEFSPG
jgi:hypothetical protein